MKKWAWAIDFSQESKNTNYWAIVVNIDLGCG